MSQGRESLTPRHPTDRSALECSSDWVYAAVEKRSASLSQPAIRFHLVKIWATISKPLILND